MVREGLRVTIALSAFRVNERSRREIYLYSVVEHVLYEPLISPSKDLAGSTSARLVWYLAVKISW
jgi:hypothetical protein